MHVCTAACHHEGVPDEMPEVQEARRAYKQADEDALKLRFRARARFGLAILEYRKKHTKTQAQVATALGVVPEQVRRYERAYRAWVKEYPREPLED